MSNEVIVKYYPFTKVECCFDIVAVVGNNVEQVFCEISPFRQNGNKLNMFNLFRLYRNDEISFDMVAQNVNGNIVEATFDFVERIIRLVAFDNVASMLLMVWMGL